MDYLELQDLLNFVGEQVLPNSNLTLLGGGALILLGNSRHTADIDIVGDDINPSPLHRQIIQVAKEKNILIDIVPIERFIPLPQGSDQRVIPIAQFGNLNIFVADPYSIALSKVDRGLDNDYADIEFLIENNHITLKTLETIVQNAAAKAGKHDLNPDILNHLQELKLKLK